MEMEWVEVHGKSVDVAVAAALKELGLNSREQARVEVIQEPTAGFLGLGGKDAIVKVSRQPKKSRRRRGRRGGGKNEPHRGGDQARASGSQGSRKKSTKAPSSKKNGGNQRPQKGTTVENKDENRPEPASIEAQAEVAKEFLTGLIDAFGLEGAVTTRIDDDILWIDVTGPQTEALVGAKGAVLQSINELTRTVVQRQTYGAPRMRLDIAGYGERRREALRIYTTRLAERLLADGGEIMLEPMNAADRKVVHDTIVDIAGISSFSEGEEPNRAVVLSLEAGYGPPADATPVTDSADDTADPATGDGAPAGDDPADDDPADDAPADDAPAGDDVD